MNRPINELLDALIEKGGSIVSSNDCSIVEIVQAQACNRFFVREDYLGFVLRPPTKESQWLRWHQVDEQRWYWHWNGDIDCCPVPTSIFKDSAGVFFRTAGQLGCGHAVNVSDLGGWFKKMYEPETPPVN